MCDSRNKNIVRKSLEKEMIVYLLASKGPFVLYILPF